MKELILYFKKMKRYINIFRHLVLYLFFWVFLGGILNAQNVVSGIVVGLSGYPLAGANIISNNDTLVTDNFGAFSIQKSDEITVKLKGYKTQIIRKPLNDQLIVLEKDVFHQPVGVAYGSQSRFGLTSSISSISSEELKDSYETNIGNALKGKLTGLTVLPSSGEPGNDAPEFLIRGLGTRNINTPIVYVDGLETSMDLLKIEEIGTISVLKDAAALAPFGIKGANGVIWVTTKRGKKGAAEIKTSLQTGMQQPNRLQEFVDSYDYARLYNQARSNDNGNVWSPYYTDAQLNAYKNPGSTDKDRMLYPNVNWYDEVLKKSAPLTNVDMSVSGGDNNIKYFLLLGYQTTQGLYSGTDSKRDVNSNNDYQKLNVRTNVDVKLPWIFDASVSFGTVIENRYSPSYNVATLWENMASYPANAYPVETPMGWGGNSIFPDNPKASVIYRGFRQNHNRTTQASVTFGQDLNFITKGLRLTETFSLMNYQNSAYYKDRNYQRFQPYLIPADTLGYAPTGSQESNFNISQTGTGRNTVSFRQTLRIALTWDRMFNLHQVHGSLLYSDDMNDGEGYNVPYLYRGFSGRFNYGYNDKYFAELGWALNGSGDFPPGKNLGFFPSLSLAWVVSNEDFIKNSSIINYLRFRGSAGLVGNSDIGGVRFAYQQYYYPGTAGPRFNTTGTSTASTLSEFTIENPNMTWEKAFKANFGTEARLFNKLDAQFDIFYERRHDILVAQNLLSSLGFLFGFANDGIVTNKGIEFNLNWKDKIGDLSYYINPVFSFARNKIVEMNEMPQAEPYLVRTGNSINQVYALEANGFFQSWDEINNPNTPVQTFATVQPGDIRYVDQNNDGVIDNNDIVPLKGHYSVPEISYGLNVGVEYKGFDLNVSGYGLANRSAYLSGVNFWGLQNGNNAPTWALDSWAYYPDQNIDNRATATYPRLSLESNSNNFRTSSFWIRNGNYFRIGELTLGYTLPRAYTMKVKIPKVRVFVKGTNLLTLDKIDQVDPEVMNGYPLMKSYNLGLNVNF